MEEVELEDVVVTISERSHTPMKNVDHSSMDADNDEVAKNPLTIEPIL